MHIIITTRRGIITAQHAKIYSSFPISQNTAPRLYARIRVHRNCNNLTLRCRHGTAPADQHANTAPPLRGAVVPILKLTRALRTGATRGMARLTHEV
jgi:hypothetical protein